MKEIVVLSGKGGTGKTTVLGSLAVLATDNVLADCDVDAADLHLLLNPVHQQENEFRSGVKARVDNNLCSGCSVCEELCQFEAVTINDTAHVDTFSCEGCGVCAHFCPEEAIILDENHCGSWYISHTPYGDLVHARLFAGEENSGKLVSLVKRKTRELAEVNGVEFILTDGPPGIGCPVIASLSNTDTVLVVTEPSLSGLHDLERVLDLAFHFKVMPYVCLNKWDLHPETADAIEAFCRKRNVEVLGRIPFDPAVVSSQLNGQPLVSNNIGPAALAIREIWEQLSTRVVGNRPEKH